jgi:hypothetical protein
LAVGDLPTCLVPLCMVLRRPSRPSLKV